MNGDKKVSVCLTVWNRPDIIVDSFKQVHDDPRVAEIIVSDDCSSPHHWISMGRNLTRFKKVKTFRNSRNLQVYDNKKISVEMASGDWVIVFDSDNRLTKEYLDCIYRQEWDSKLILAPSFAKPSFNYKKFAGLTFDRHSIKPWLNLRLFDCLLNTMNYFCNRNTYLSAWEPAPDILGADSIHLNYLMLKSGVRMRVIEGLEYEHLVHRESNYKVHFKRSEPMCKRELRLIGEL